MPDIDSSDCTLREVTKSITLTIRIIIDRFFEI